MHVVQVIDQNILRLNISVYDVSFLTVQKCFNNLSYDNLGCCLIKLLDPSQPLKQISPLTKFEDSVYILLIIEIAI